MIYLDYSATTPVNENVLDNFIKNIDNDNLSIEEEKKRIQSLFNTNLDVIYTSGSTESNNMAIKGIALKYLGDLNHNHIITTALEHSSISSQMSYLANNGFDISYVSLKDGVVDLDELKKLITDRTILVSIASVNSETGIIQPIEKISQLLVNYPHVLFHSDMTQSVGKVNIDINGIDLVSFTAHKFYGLKGIGCLLKKKDISLIPLVYGDRTYNKALIKSLGDALEIALSNIEEKYNYVLKLNKMLKEKLIKYDNVSINSDENAIPHILNISIKNFKPETFQHTLELDDIYISTKSACSKSNDYSKAVYALTNDMGRAKSSVRISLSCFTKKEDILKLSEVFAKLFKL